MKASKDLSLPVLFSLIANQILFGINYLLSKEVLHFLPPLLWASLRALITGLCLLLILSRTEGLKVKRVKENLLPLFLLGLVGVALNQGCFLLGLRYTTPTNSALINTLIPVFTLALVSLRKQETPGPLRLFGFMLAFFGVVYLQHPETFSFAAQGFRGDLYTLANAFFYASFLAFGKSFVSKHSSLWSTAWIFIFGGSVLALMALPEWLSYQWQPLPWSFWGAAFFGIFGGTLLPYLLVAYSLGRVASSTVALFVYIAPIVATGLSCVFLNERLDTRLLVSMLLVFGGVFLVLFTKAPQPHPLKPG